MIPQHETIQISNVYNTIVVAICFNDQPWTQIDSGAKCSDTNNVNLLWDIKWFNDICKSLVYMKVDTSDQPIVLTVLNSVPFVKDFSWKILPKYFELNNELIHNDPKHNETVTLNGTCTLTCIQKKVKRFNVDIPDIICDGLYFKLLIAVPDLPINNPRTNLFNCSQSIYGSEELFLQTPYEI